MKATPRFLLSFLLVLSICLSTALACPQAPPSTGSSTTTPPKSCKEVKSTEPRKVVVLYDGTKVMCDTKTEGGGWLVIQRRVDGTEDFFRDWTDYKYGFGKHDKNFWIGNEKIFRLTTKQKYELRVDFKYGGKDFYAKYSSFRVLGEPEKYMLEVSGYQGNAGDSLSYHNKQKFSTWDQDNDQSPDNCANKYHGAWWYKNCHNVNLNGLWGANGNGRGLNWKAITGWGYTATFSEMKIRPV